YYFCSTSQKSTNMRENWYKITIASQNQQTPIIYYGSSKYNEEEICELLMRQRPILLENLQYVTQEGDFEEWDDEDDVEYGRIYIQSRYVQSFMPLQRKPSGSWFGKMKKWIR
ncbi:MAG: hypothetical protein AB8B69_00725, partial [Chitinophagales bacterium]